MMSGEFAFNSCPGVYRIPPQIQNEGLWSYVETSALGLEVKLITCWESVGTGNQYSSAFSHIGWWRDYRLAWQDMKWSKKIPAWHLWVRK